MLAGREISEGERIAIAWSTTSPRRIVTAMVFQSYALYPHMSVYDNMAFGLRLRKTPKHIIDQRVREAAQVTGH
jgi:ABC-type sugar transport system ATPase subunit